MKFCSLAQDVICKLSSLNTFTKRQNVRHFLFESVCRQQNKSNSKIENGFE